MAKKILKDLRLAGTPGKSQVRQLTSLLDAENHFRKLS